MTPEGPDSPSGLVDRLAQALERQRAALVSSDAAALASTSEEVVSLLEALSRAPAGAIDVAALQRARTSLRANAELLMNASGANSRALAVMFQEAATYGPGGAAALATPSRSLRSA